MKPLTVRQTILWASVLAVVFVGFQAWRGAIEGAPALAFSGMLFFLISYFSMRLSARVSTWAAEKTAPPEPEPPEPIEATTDRPEHVARRRQQRRRKRSYRKKR
jgi:hypothetical protein